MRILPVEGALLSLDFGLWGNDASDLAFASLLDECGLSGSATTGESGFALATKGVESKLCDEGTSERTDFDGKRVCFTVAVGSHVFNSVDLILWFSTGFSWVPTKGGCAHSWEFDANHMQKEACMLIQLTSLHVAWAAFDVNPRWSNVVTMFLAQYPLAPTSMAKELLQKETSCWVNSITRVKQRGAYPSKRILLLSLLMRHILLIIVHTNSLKGRLGWQNVAVEKSYSIIIEAELKIKIYILWWEIYCHFKPSLQSVDHICREGKAICQWLCSSLKPSTVSDMICSSFTKATVFAKSESTWVSCTCVALVKFAVNTGIVNQGYFAFYFMKDKETTTILHYNVLSYRRETIRLAMYLGSPFNWKEPVACKYVQMKGNVY